MTVELSRIAAEYPFTTKSLSIGGRKYSYVDEGVSTGPERECILMLHGNPTWSFYYRKLIAGLCSDYRVVAPDHIGCGFSDKPEDYSYRLENHISNVERLVEELDLKNITLVVHDWGGAIGFGFAMRHPHLIKRLVIFNTAAFSISSFPWYLRACQIPYVGAFAVRHLNLFVSIAARVGCVDKSLLQGATKEGYVGPYDSYRNRIAIHRFIQDIPFTKDHPSRALAEEIEKNISTFRDTPARIFWGLQDPVFSKVFLKKWKELLPNALSHEFPDAGHYIVEERPDEILTEMRAFLRDERHENRSSNA